MLTLDEICENSHRSRKSVLENELSCAPPASVSAPNLNCKSCLFTGVLSRKKIQHDKAEIFIYEVQ